MKNKLVYLAGVILVAVISYQFGRMRAALPNLVRNTITDGGIILGAAHALRAGKATTALKFLDAHIRGTKLILSAYKPDTPRELFDAHAALTARVDAYQNQYPDSKISPIGTAMDFREALRSGDHKAGVSLLTFPVELVETVYEAGDGSCAPHYRKSLIHSTQEAEKVLAPLRKAWASGKIMQGNKPAYYGVVGEGDCEHFWAIKLDPEKKQIIGLVIDASNNVWDPSRKDFNLTDLP